MLNKGDHVRMINCTEAENSKSRDRIWTVMSEPWNLCGTMVVRLEGRAGGFDCNCLEKVEV